MLGLERSKMGAIQRIFFSHFHFSQVNTRHIVLLDDVWLDGHYKVICIDFKPKGGESVFNGSHLGQYPRHTFFAEIDSYDGVIGFDEKKLGVESACVNCSGGKIFETELIHTEMVEIADGNTFIV